jgi:GTPase SAR1 family protein
MSVPSHDSDKIPSLTVKLLLLGESSVGKTSLVTRYATQTFCPNNMLTIGIEVRKINKRIGDKNVRLERK